jgi:prophage antirepressor-like protein
MTNENVEVWVFEGSTVRTVQMNGEPWFIAKDIAEVLGYSNTRKAISDHVDDDDKGVTKCDTPGGMQDLTIINESGLYSLVLSSKMPNAKKFKKWVTSEVLPAIRKHGMYAIDDVLNDPDMLINALLELKEERAKTNTLEQTVAVQTQQIAELQPKASYYDKVLECNDLVPISIIAKDYGWSANHMNQVLREKGVQYKQGGKIWLLYQKYAEMGLTSTKTYYYDDANGHGHVVPHTHWTQKGRLFIYDLLKEDGILPIMEREF